MKRCWLGAAVLVLLLILGLLCSGWTNRFFSEASGQMLLAAQSDPQEAWLISQQVLLRWEQRGKLHAALYDHAPMEQIDTLFALLDPEADTFRENCIRLSQAFHGLARTQQPSLDNLF